ncbi:MAG: trimethylamine methyltransferase family protein, partial [Alphaproteobacteria bacterium]
MARDPSRRRAHRAAEGLRQLPWREVVNPYAPIEVLSADQVETIHAASLRVLEETGMRVLDAGARERLARAGADGDQSSMLVRFDRGLIEESVARAPAEFRLRARNPARSVTVGG